VARHGGQVVFVRHALPGEWVRARVTERRTGFLRADAVEVLEAAPDRIAAPCPYARPGACGGCDFQHARPAAQRGLKGAVVAEQLARLAGLERTVEVQALPGDGFGWRSRVRYAVDPAGRLGFHRHRSSQVQPVDRCLIAHPAIQALPLTAERWGGYAAVEAVASSGGDIAVRAIRGGTAASERTPRNGRAELLSGPPVLHEQAAGRVWTIDAGAFWQVHPAAADVLVDAVLELLDPRPGERAWDLYGGAGLFAAALATRLGPRGRVTSVEGDRRGSAAARRNLADLGQARIVRADVAEALTDPRWRSVDLVVLDPPRSGAGAGVVGQVTARRPRAVAYVACDPAAFARDVRTFGAAGYHLAELRAFDCFPQTHHVECVGLLVR
jgi:tRNA/tmRNA/rRNA uracil-C5-methylase (TrmA/RlmC/RlmD family)